jgi:hypothetical protein
MIGLNPQRPPITGLRLRRLLQRLQYQPQIAVEGRVSCMDRDRPLNQRGRSRMLARLVSDHAQQMQAVGVVRLRRQQLPISPLGVGQPPRTMQANRAVVDLLQRRRQARSLSASRLCPDGRRGWIVRGNEVTSP